jgi:tetratricopeptide (TPR) repeat protein
LKGRSLALASCALFAVLLYLPTLRNDFVFDDRAIIEQNPLTADLRLLPGLLVAPYWNAPHQSRTLYRPLTSATFAVDRAVAGGMQAWWFHLVNVLLHGAATLLLTWLALEVLPGLRGPAIAGALFAAHPVHVEAVAGIVGRAEILAACGVLAAVLCHRRALRSGGRSGIGFMCASWAAFFLAMLCKESAVIAPILCLLGERVGVAAPGTARRRAAALAGYAAALGIYLALRFAAIGSLGIGAPIPFVDNPAASAGPLASRLTALGVVARYAGLLVWPARLSADYSYDQVSVIASPADPLALSGLLLVVLVVGGGARLLRRAPACGYALLWVAVTASVTSNLVVPIGTLMAERLMYLPSAGACLLAGWLVVRLGRGPAQAAATALLALAVAAAAGRAWTRLPDWRDDFALYRSAARISPRSARIRFNLGNAHLRRGEYLEAEENYYAALAIYPQFNDVRVNLGMALLKHGRAGEALGWLRAAAAQEPRNVEIVVDLGLAYRALGRTAEAETEFRRALEHDPGSARAHNNLGSIALSRGDSAAAIAHLQDAVRLEPTLAILRVNLADALNAAGRGAEAAEQFEAAFRLDPDLPESHRGRGEVALQRGDLAAAEREFQIAAGSREPSARAANFLGYLLAQRGEHRTAADQYEAALRIDPGLHDAHRSLGLLYIRSLGDPDRGAGHLETSLRLDPFQPGAEELRALVKRVRRNRP